MKAPEVAAKFRLEPVGGPEHGSFPVPEDAPVVIGRSQECGVCLVDASISRRHASLARRDDRWVVTDLGSRHGSFVNGIRLPPDCPAPAAPGDHLRFGPYTFRLEGEAEAARPLASTDGAVPPGTLVERVPARELESTAHRRLDLLIDGATAVHQAADEESLARAILDLALAGSGYHRAALLRPAGTAGRFEVVACRAGDEGAAEDFSFSRSLLAEASSGHIARLASSSGPALGQSIERLQIHSALCAPIAIDSSVVAYVYLDSRESEQAGDSDALGFCHAISKFAGLALANLRRAELERRQSRLQADLEAAQQAQAFLAPAQEGTVGRLRFAMETCPGRVVAGDLFDVVPIDDRRTGLCFGDVCGQGMGAAILMTAVLSTLRAALVHHRDPAAAANDVNRYIAVRSAAHMFVSLWVGVFDEVERALHYVDAGHGHWLLKRHGEPPVPAGRPAGLLAGIEPDFVYGAETIALDDGDRVVLYSDGLVEHRSVSGEPFGRDRLVDIVAASDSCRNDVTRGLAALREFIGGIGLEDDTSLASIEICATSAS